MQSNSDTILQVLFKKFSFGIVFFLKMELLKTSNKPGPWYETLSLIFFQIIVL